MSKTDVSALWEQATRQLRSILRQDVYQRWIAVIEPVSFDGVVLELAVDNDFYQTWLEEHYLPLIHNAVSSVCGATVDIAFAVRKQPAAPELPAAPAPETQKQPVRQRAAAAAPREGASPLNERFTFDKFIVGSCNSFAHAASLAVAQSPARAYNPLFIYGGTGLGKTHLMQAIGHYVLLNSRAAVSYISCEAFINEYINALQSRGLVRFRNKYRHVDLLLIDDIHFLGGKERLQEEFFHTFNALFDSHKQIVMTSDRPASEISGLQQRLVSRFEWGLVTEVEHPDLETRIAILRHKLAGMNAALPDEVLAFIAQNVKSNIRRLEGALIRVISYAALIGKPISQKQIEHLLRDTISEERQESLTFGAIQKSVAEYYDLRVSDLTGKRRPKTIAVPRQVAMFLCRRLTDASLPEIAGAFDKTHATVIHACRRIESRMLSDNDFRRNLQTIGKQLGKNL